jgi:hypothetical protein
MPIFVYSNAENLILNKNLGQVLFGGDKSIEKVE